VQEELSEHREDIAGKLIFYQQCTFESYFM